MRELIERDLAYAEWSQVGGPREDLFGGRTEVRAATGLGPCLWEWPLGSVGRLDVSCSGREGETTVPAPMRLSR